MKSVIGNIAASAAVFAAVAFVPVTARAHMSDDGQSPPIGNHLKKMAKELHLSPQQKQQIKDVFTKNRPVAQPLMKQLMTERRALRSLIQADTIDEAAIRAESAKIAGLQADLAVHRAHVDQEVRGILTPEQAATAKELQVRRDRKMEELAARVGKRSEPEQ